MSINKFKVGDEVIVNKNGFIYNWTKQDSKGFVMAVYEKSLRIKFYEMTGPIEPNTPYIWNIDSRHLEHLTRNEWKGKPR